MSNIILQSAENSALLQTLNQSESKVIPSIYNTPTIYAPSATNWYTLIPKTGSVTPGQPQVWDLSKYGILQQIVFTYEKTISYTTTADDTVVEVPSGDVFNLIDRVEYLSSSRILCTLYSEDIIAQLKSLSTDEYSTISKFISATSKTGVTGATSLAQKVTIPIVFPFFNQQQTCPNLQFNEPVQLRIVYRDPNKYRTSGTAPTGISFSFDTKIMLRYKMYSESDTAQLLASNYEQEQLNMLTSKYYRENPVSYTVGANKEDNHKFTMELKNVDVCQDFYFMVRGPTGTAEDASQNKLLPINRVRLTASGQELCDLNADQLLYMKVTKSGWPVNSSYLASSMGDPMDINNVALVQTGLWTWDRDEWTNGWSLREMNNVVAEVYVDLAANKTFTCYCQELTSCILSTSSNVGRQVISLSN